LPGGSRTPWTATKGFSSFSRPSSFPVSPDATNAAAQTRIVSKARIRLDSGKSVRSFKGIICVDISEFESFSIGAGLCQALSDCSVDLMWEVTRRVLASLRDRHLGPPMMGSGGCGGPIYRGVLAVRLTAGIRTRNGLASSIVLRGHRSTGRRNSRFLLFLLCTTRCEMHERHKCALTARALALVCSVALSGQAPKPHSGAPQARGLTANAPTEQSSVLPRCAPPSDTPGHVAVASFLVCRFCCPPRDSRYRAAGLDARGQRGCDAARGVAS